MHSIPGHFKVNKAVPIPFLKHQYAPSVAFIPLKSSPSNCSSTPPYVYTQSPPVSALIHFGKIYLLPYTARTLCSLLNITTTKKWRVKRLKLVIVVRKPSLSVVCAARWWKTGKMRHYSARASARSGYTATVPVSQWTNTKNSAPAKSPFSALPAVDPSISSRLLS